MSVIYEGVVWWITNRNNDAIIGKILKNEATEAQLRYIKQEIEKNDNLILMPFYIDNLANDKMINKINRLSKNDRN